MQIINEYLYASEMESSNLYPSLHFVAILTQILTNVNSFLASFSSYSLDRKVDTNQTDDNFMNVMLRPIQSY